MVLDCVAARHRLFIYGATIRVGKATIVRGTTLTMQIVLESCVFW